MKTKNLTRFTAYKHQHGFTMLEILVALLLGVGILTATISMQIQHRKGFKLSSNKLTMQTNAKFAIEFISQSLRPAGSMGCKNGIELTNGAVNVSDNCLGSVCIAFTDPTIAFADFRPGFEVLGYEYASTALSPLPPTAFTFVSSSQYNSDSDVITVAGGYGESYALTNATILAVDSEFQLDVSNVDNIRLKQSQYGMLTSCKGAFIFKVTSSDSNIKLGKIQWAGGGSEGDDNQNGQLGTRAETFVGGGAITSREFRRAAVTTYFVGMYPLGDANGVPSLYQDVDGVSKRLIEGVEEVHYLYGVSSSPTVRNIADQYVTADVVDNGDLWPLVVSVRIGLIMRSAKEVYKTDQSQTKTLDCVEYTQATKSDKYARSTYCSEVSLRNRLTGVRVGEKV